MNAVDASLIKPNTRRSSIARVPACGGGQNWAQEAWHIPTPDGVQRYDAGWQKVKGPRCSDCAVNDKRDGIFVSR